MINIAREQELKLTAQEIYDIISLAVEAADDDGFINSYIFERAVVEFTILSLYEEYANKYNGNDVLANVLGVWNEMLEDGILARFVQDYPEEQAYVFEIAAQWVIEYEKCAHSVRGLLASMSGFTNKLVERYQNIAKEMSPEAMDSMEWITKIAEEYGIDRPTK